MIGHTQATSRHTQKSVQHGHTRVGESTKRNLDSNSINGFIDTEIILSHTDGDAGEKDEINRDVDVDGINYSNHEVEDLGKETTEYDIIHPSTEPQGDEIFETENEVYGSTTMRAAGADEKARTSVDL